MQTTPAQGGKPAPGEQPAPSIPANLLDVIQTLWRWRWPVIIATGVAFFGAIALSLLMKVYFKGETRFLALSPDQSAPETLFGTTGMKPQLYGNMNDIDRLLAVAESNELADRLIDSFQLYAHYDIDPEKPKASILVRRKFFGLYEVTKTPKDAIMIEVEDEDPAMAAALANAAREEVDRISRMIIKDAQRKNIQALESEIRSKQALLARAGDSLRRLRTAYQIYDIETQTEVLSTELSGLQQQLATVNARIKAYERSRVRGARDSIAKLEVTVEGLEQARVSLDSQLVKLNEGRTPIQNLRENRAILSRNLNDDDERLQQFQTALRSTQPTIALLEAAQVPEIKSRPKRSFIVVGATFATFIFAVLAALLIDNGRRYRWREILS